MNFGQSYIKRLLLVFSLGGVLSTRAQEIGVQAHAGLSRLQYSASGASSQAGLGEGFGLFYSIPVHKHWSIVSGIGADHYTGKTSLQDNTFFTENMVDASGSAFQYQVTTKGYQEKQSFWAVTIPVMAAYETSISSHWRWYANAGGKLLIPAGKMKLESSASQLNLYGYYPDVNVTIKDMPQHGFGSQSNWNDKNSVSDLQAAVLASVESGVKARVGGRCNLYVGLFLDYGVTNVVKKNGDSFVSYNANAVSGVKVNGVFATNAVGAVKTLGYGISVKLGWVRR